MIPKVFPDSPTGYIEIEKIKSSKTWVAPEDGFFQFIGLAASGDGGHGDSAMHGEKELAGGGSGGSGGITVCNFTLNKGDTISLSVGGSVSISHGGKKATATSGGRGTDGNVGHPTTTHVGTGGSAGTASGGNLKNIAGSRGNSGSHLSGNEYSQNDAAGESVSTSYGKYSTISGSGNNNKGSAAYIVVLRGNTNLTQAQLNSYDITTLMIDNSRLEQEITGIMLSQSAQ